ncbi:hypothetical protein ACGFLT_25455 [Micromonospora chalcea]|nr:MULTISPECIES: hypothetical protein [unclassified Micromonospora]OKJ44388.1 hypothetical protein AMK25_15245 [Micromonospora sp. TSRI0369]
MQDASLASLTKVQHLSVIGEQTTDNAGTFVASMVQSRCNLVVLSGQAPGAAATAASARFPAQQFVAVGDQPSDSRANVTWVAGSPDAVRIKVRDAVLDAARAAER